jgi:hypothetical protein
MNKDERQEFANMLADGITQAQFSRERAVPRWQEFPNSNWKIIATIIGCCVACIIATWYVSGKVNDTIDKKVGEVSGQITELRKDNKNDYQNLQQQVLENGKSQLPNP